jgi:hypothetical protein
LLVARKVHYQQAYAHFHPAPTRVATATTVAAEAVMRTTLLLLKTVHLSMIWFLCVLDDARDNCRPGVVENAEGVDDLRPGYIVMVL